MMRPAARTFLLRVDDLDATRALSSDIVGSAIEMLDENRAGTRPFVSARVDAQLIDLVPDRQSSPS